MSDKPKGRGVAFAAILALIIVNLGIELALLAADHGLLGSKQWRQIAYQNGAFWAGLLHNWRPNYTAQPYTMFLSYAFLHGGTMHMIGNMLTLALLARPVIARIGVIGFALIYIVSALGGAAGFGALTNSPSPMVGASGALFGLVGAMLYWRWSDDRSLHSGHWATLKTMAGLAALNLIIWLAMDRILAWETHLGGFITGWAVAVALQWRKTTATTTG